MVVSQETHFNIRMEMVLHIMKIRSTSRRLCYENTSCLFTGAKSVWSLVRRTQINLFYLFS